MEDTLNWNDLNTETIAFTNEININNIKKDSQIPFFNSISAQPQKVSKSSIDNLIINSNNSQSGGGSCSKDLSSFHNVFKGGGDYDFNTSTSFPDTKLSDSSISTITGYSFPNNSASSNTYSLSNINLDSDNSFMNASTSFNIDFEDTSDNELATSDIDIISVDSL